LLDLFSISTDFRCIALHHSFALKKLGLLFSDVLNIKENFLLSSIIYMKFSRNTLQVLTRSDCFISH
jgi:hypothetical protein